jgi:predicted aconitase
MHLDEQRSPNVTVKLVEGTLTATYHSTGDHGTAWFGALGRAIGERLQALGGQPVAYIRGVAGASLEELKSFCASLATYGGAALFHMQGITPEAVRYRPPRATIAIDPRDLDAADRSLNDASLAEVDFVSLGCPHLSIREIAHLAELLAGKRITREFWITTARPTKQIADQMGYTATIEASGAKFAADTCCVVAPIQGRFRALATDSAKACFYAAGKNKFKTLFLPFDEVVAVALGEVSNGSLSNTGGVGSI